MPTTHLSSANGSDRRPSVDGVAQRSGCATRGSDSNGAKSHVKGRSWDRLASQDLSPSVSQGTIWLTPMESRVAVWLAEGKSVRDMAEATGRTQGSIYWHLKQIYQKQPVSRQADLVRLVLSSTEFG